MVYVLFFVVLHRQEPRRKDRLRGWPELCLGGQWDVLGS